MMATLPTGLYLFDGGQSRAIHSSLQAIVDQNKAASAASFAAVLYRQRGGSFIVLASSGSNSEYFRQNEPVLVPRFPRGRLPVHIDGFTIRSLLRPWSMDLNSAIVMPFSDEYGAGGVIVGDPASDGCPDGFESAKESLAIADMIRRARQMGALRIQRDLYSALSDIASANTSILDPELRIQAVLQSARALFGSDVSYLAVPEPCDGIFTFSQTLGIRTRGFKSLRVGEGDGLGGLARTLRRPVRSFDYYNDDRLQSAPLVETRKEGILSAMATPIMVKNDVAAVVYIGNRRLRAYSPTDESLMDEFAGFAALALEQNKMDAYREQLILRSSREQMAYALHDTVVRRLVEIGFVIEQSSSKEPSSTSEQRFSLIAQAVESAMDALRGQISEIFAGEVEVHEVNAYEVMNRIMELRHTSEVARTHGENVDLRWANMSAAAASAVIRIGQEAVMNAERHSGCRNIHVQLDTGRDTVTLTVQDDGRGMSPDVNGSRQSKAGHLGIKGMRDAASSVGGVLSFGVPSGGGLIVTAKVRRLDSMGVS